MTEQPTRPDQTAKPEQPMPDQTTGPDHPTPHGRPAAAHERPAAAHGRPAAAHGRPAVAHGRPAAAPEGSATPEPRGLGRQRLLTALRSRPSRGQLIAAVLCAVLGFAVVVQVRANQGSALTGLRQTDLVRILDDVSERSARLQAEAQDLQETRDQVTGGSSGTRAALDDARQRSRTLAILAGTVAARGPGIEFTISDPDGKVGSDVLLDALQELRDAGGEAFEIGTVGGRAVRVVASTYLTDTDSGISVEGTPLQSPYRFRVIGDPRTLAAALDIPGGVLDVLRQRKAQGVVTQRTTLDITTLRPVPAPEHARPAQDSRGG